MCTRGRVCVRSPLPSLVTMTDEPVSAMRKLAPVMPTSAARNFPPQPGAGLGQQVAALVEHAVLRQVRMRLAEALLPVLDVEVEGRRDDMRRRLLAQLDDVLAEIGLDRRDAVALQMVVDPELFGDHRLALGHGLGPGVLADLQHGRARLVRRAAPMHRAARALHVGGIGLEVEVEVRDRVILDVPPDVPKLLELRQPPHGGGAALEEGPLGGGQRLLQAGIGHRPAGVFLELRRGGEHRDVLRLVGHTSPAWARAKGEARAGSPEA